MSLWCVAAVTSTLAMVTTTAVVTNASATTRPGSTSRSHFSAKPPNLDDVTTLSAVDQPTPVYQEKQKPPPVAGSADAADVDTPKAYGGQYFYGTAYSTQASDGMQAMVTVAAPTLGAHDDHTLAELAAQSADGRQIVEVGWIVDRSNATAGRPSLFVYHWVDGGGSCYNGCGFVQVSSKMRPGDPLTTGGSIAFGILHYKNNWWIGAGTEWVGYFPDSLWKNSFTKTGLMQWFGEVAGDGSKPCSDMGNGKSASSTDAARFSSVLRYTDVLKTATAGLTTHAPTPNLYTVAAVNDSSFRFGGPGAC